MISMVALAAALAVLLVIAPRVYGGHDISHYMGNVVPSAATRSASPSPPTRSA